MLAVFNSLCAGLGYVMVTVENTFSDATVAQNYANCTFNNNKETTFICAPKRYFTGELYSK